MIGAKIEKYDWLDQFTCKFPLDSWLYSWISNAQLCKLASFYKPGEAAKGTFNASIPDKPEYSWCPLLYWHSDHCKSNMGNLIMGFLCDSICCFNKCSHIPEGIQDEVLIFFLKDHRHLIPTTKDSFKLGWLCSNTKIRLVWTVKELHPVAPETI